jgi:Zn-dependent peptidase ImmA (M78 family)
MVNKIPISKIASFIASTFSNGNITNLEEILNYESLPCHLDHYEDYFDGMLVYDEQENNFHVHINIDRGNNINLKRGRFTLAHELGHFFLDNHRIGLKYDLIKPHGSKHEVNQKELIEIEADYFAGCLLMPEEKFRKSSGGKTFSLSTLLALSENFQASLLATSIRFTEIGTHEITIVVSKNGIVKWFSKSKDFPNWAFRCKVHEAVPPTTVVGEYSRNSGAKYTTQEELDPNDWFWANDFRSNRRMYEQCYYSKSYGYIISVIWFA